MTNPEMGLLQLIQTWTMLFFLWFCYGFKDPPLKNPRFVSQIFRTCGLGRRAGAKRSAEGLCPNRKMRGWPNSNEDFRRFFGDIPHEKLNKCFNKRRKKPWLN